MTDEETPTLGRRGFLRGTAAAGGAAALAALPASAASPDLTAGAAKRDITPANGGEFFGYVRPDMRADGVAIRLFAHALVLDDGDRKVALVSLDLGSPQVKAAVVNAVADRGFSTDTVLFAATHTHAGPFLAGEFIAGQIADAIREADDAREPAEAGWGVTEVFDANRSRSVGAHLANHGMEVTPGSGSPKADPDGPEHTRNTTLRLLRVQGTDGTPIAAWTQFPVHPTAYTPDNTTFSADLAGAATRRFAARFGDAGGPGGDAAGPGGDDGAPLTMFTNGTVGDLIPIYDDYNQHALADVEGERIADGMADAWENASEDLSRQLPVDGVAETRTFQGQEVAPGKRVGTNGFWGLPTLAGAENGPSPFFAFGLHGKRRPEALADPVHGRKVIASHAPYTNDVEVQAMRVGDRLLVTVPGEPTTQMGRRMRRAAADAAPDVIDDVAVCGITNGYNAYFTTPEEYEQQYYEGGHTVFGKYSSLLIRNAQVDLAGSIGDGSGTAGTSGGSGPSQGDLPTGPVAPGKDQASGSLTGQPAAEVERMDTVTVSWRGGPLGVDRPVGEPFVELQRRTAEDWTTVDSDLGLGFVWTERAGEYTVRYDVPPALPTGRYRLAINGAGYDLHTEPFEVVASDGLRLLGARVEPIGQGADNGNGVARVVVKAQHPQPDPERNLRTRAERPTGGEVRFTHGGRAYTATFDADAGGWVARVPGASEGDAIEVPAGGLVDGNGNRSGTAASLTLGEVAEVEWPPNMGPAGGKAPGPAGVGTIPP